MKSDAFNPELPLRISEPPNHSTMAIEQVPRNSLIGWARLCRRAILFDNL